jgi:excisionase family DNA binding protein
LAPEEWAMLGSKRLAGGLAGVRPFCLLVFDAQFSWVCSEWNLEWNLGAVACARVILVVACGTAGSEVPHTLPYITVAEAASDLGQDRETIRRWIRSGHLPARRAAGRYVIEPCALRVVEDELFPMAKPPDEWKLANDGSPAPNWVAALHRSRRGS